MLHFIRDKAKGWVAWLIVGLISIPFALWGVNSYMTGPSAAVVAKVNGHEITQPQLQQAVQQYRDQMRSTLGEQFDPQIFEGDAIRVIILEDLIEQRLLFDTAGELGQRVPDRQVAQFIRSTPAFQINDRFDAQQYAMVLARAGFTPTSYESQLRSDLLNAQLTQHIERGAVASEKEVMRLMQLENQQRQIGYAVIAVNDFLSEVNITEAYAREFYDANIAAYTVPAQVSIDYLRLSVDEIAENLEFAEADLVQFYADNRQQFLGAEQRRASHILFEGDDETALEKAEEISAKLQAGEDFSALAAEFSDDTGSASEGGDLGYIQLDVMEPAFEMVLFSLDEGQFSAPVKTDFGYHLILVTDIQQAEGQSFEEARDAVEAQYREQTALMRFYDLADQLANLTFENPENLDVAAEAIGLEVQTSPLFTGDGTSQGLTSDNRIIEAAFQDDVLNQEMNSTLIELSENDFVVLRKNSFKAAEPVGFSVVAEAITQQLRFQQASDLANIAGESRLTQLNAGDAPEEVFGESQWQAVARYSRGSESVSEQVLRHAFAMPRAESVSFSGFTAENGNYIVVGLYGIEDDEVSDIETDLWDGLRAELVRLNANSELNAFIASLRANAKIQILDSRLAVGMN